MDGGICVVWGGSIIYINDQVYTITDIKYLIKVKNNIVSQGQLLVVLHYLPVRSNINIHLNNNLNQPSNLVVSQA